MSGIMSMVLGAKTAIAAAVDAYFNLVTLLLPGDGTNGAQNNTFLDSSTNNFTITRNGNTTQGTFSPFSQTGWGNYFGGDGNYITAPYNAAFDYGTGDFSVECFAYIIDAGRGADSSKYGTLLSGGAASSNTNLWNLGFLITSGVISSVFFDNGGSNVLTASSQSISLNAWHHFVLCRTGTTLSIFVDGTRIVTATYSTAINTNSSGNVQIARSAYGSIYQNWASGYFSNVRIVKGTQPYNAASSTITQPTAALTAITNTSLLTCQDNRFRDASSNAFAITVNGTPSVQTFSPFAPTDAYSASTNGGSGYFDGTGDYLTAANNAAFLFGTGDFTVEAWVYPTALSGSTNNTIACVWATSQQAWFLGINSSNTVIVGYGSGGSSGSSTFSYTFTTNQWYHIAVTRSGTNLKVFVNGTQAGATVTNSTNITSTASLSVGANLDAGPTQYWNGYISGLRVLKGTAQYTANFTVPTSPPTNITNTSFLNNYTNAGITDATAKNDLETVGNAQISTTQSKFGGSSMYFDGTGDYLLIPSSNVNSPLFDFGSGNWTVEFWVNWTTAPSASTEFRLWWSSVRSPGTARLDLYIYNNIVYAGWSGTNVLDSGSLSWNTGQWYHMAFVRSGNSWAAFRDGTRIASATNSTTLVSSPAKIIGENVNAYIDDFRVTTGYARYDPSQTTVTIPTAAFALQ